MLNAGSHCSESSRSVNGVTAASAKFPMDLMNRVKIAVLGDAKSGTSCEICFVVFNIALGKTSLIAKISGGLFPEAYSGMHFMYRIPHFLRNTTSGHSGYPSC